MKRFFDGYSRAYLLPSTILLGLAISIASGTFLAFTATSSQTLNRQNYNAMAEEAARSGIAYADSCLTQGRTWQPNQLKPNTNCDGTENAPGVGSKYVTVHGTEWQSRFVVTQNVAQGIVTSKGFVELLDGRGEIAATFEKQLSMSAGEAFDTYPTSTGQSITDIKNDGTDCAIANGGLYCWGDNFNGQVGIGEGGFGADKNTPRRVGGALTGKTVTTVSVSDSTVCAVADGEPYCWGANAYNQLGNDIDGNILLKNDVWKPTANVPRTSSGPLSGQFVTDIGTASKNNPAALVWVFSTANQHSCALTADGSVSCWGYGGFRQLTGGGCVELILVNRCSYPSHQYPTLVNGYADDTGPFAGKKGVRIGASSHDSCVVADGVLYCWGVRAPLLPEGFDEPIDTFEKFLRAITTNFEGLKRLSCTLPLGMFSDPNITLWPYNLCVPTYSNGYDATNSNLSEAKNTLLDPATFDVSSNEGCWMANRDFYCFGVTPAFATFWAEAFRAPWKVISNTDVTDADNGDYNDVLTGGIFGLYCIVEKGVGKCAGQPGNPHTGTGSTSSAYKQFRQLSTATGLAGQTATKIAAGVNHGCVVANGRLYCWGSAGSGRLANGSFSADFSTPTLTGTSGPSPIGTGAGQYAAHGSVSVGEGHSCAIANGKVFCWGRNDYGQLGMGDNVNVSQPRALPLLANKAATKVSSGKNHTCAITEGQLYCWGYNRNGQLGLGSTNTTELIPKLVNGHGALTMDMRVTDVSTNDDNTCAVANAKVYCWGANANKQLGDGSTADKASPVLVNGGLPTNPINGKAATAVSVGRSHACAVANADLYCWGNNADGRTGLGISSGNSDPTRVNKGSAALPLGKNNVLPSVSAVSAGSNFTCAIINAKPSCWGSNADGRTGHGMTTGNTMIPTAVTGTAGAYFATSISAGRDHACALLHGNNSKSTGNMYCWGKGADGRLGYGDTNARAAANGAITGGTDMLEGGELRSATSISAGASTSCAIANAVILCWGNGANGILGTGNLGVTSSMTPTKTTSYQIRSSAYVRGPVY